MKKPVRLEINTHGAWKVIARFDADDSTQLAKQGADCVLQAAEDLSNALASSGCRNAMRVSMVEYPNSVLLHFDAEASEWKVPEVHG